MSINLWMAFLSYTVITALSPGPNNILALNATAKFGMRGSRRLLWGIYIGFSAVQILCGIFSSALVALLPGVLPYMKYVGAAYILWLAYHVAVSNPAVEDSGTSGMSFTKGFVLQFVNVKTILWGITAFTGYILPIYSAPMEIAAFTLLLILIGDAATFVWAVSGAVLQKILRKYWRTANVVMALMLLYSAVHLAIV